MPGHDLRIMAQSGIVRIPVLKPMTFLGKASRTVHSWHLQMML